MFESAVFFWGWASITGCKLQQAKATGFRAQKNNYNEQTNCSLLQTYLPLTPPIAIFTFNFFLPKKLLVSSYQQIQINNSNKICNIILMCFLNSSSHSAIFCVHRFLLLITFVRGRRWRHECAALRNKKCGEYVKVLSKIKNTTHTHTHLSLYGQKSASNFYRFSLLCVLIPSFVFLFSLHFLLLYFFCQPPRSRVFWFCFANWKHNKTHTLSHTHPSIHTYYRTQIWHLGSHKNNNNNKKEKNQIDWSAKKNLLQLFGRQFINAVDNVLTGTKGYHHTFGCWRVSFIKSC